MKGIINYIKVVEEQDEEEETTILNLVKGGMTSLMLGVIIVINLDIILESVLTTNHIQENANIVNDKIESKDLAFLVVLKNIEKTDASSWFLDNGASNHMCGNKEMFM